ncbi:hypothetical protein D5086_023904 [Populus alba]|uniref:Uncharacterized protein n=1 Tax=Populus alba TaxID=43335 RepID=A0ACC4BB48_POPAL
METATQNPPQHCIKDPVDSPANTNITISDHHDLLPQLQSLQQSFDTIQSKSSLMEENLLLQHERDDALRNNSQLNLVIQEVSKEREPFHSKIPNTIPNWLWNLSYQCIHLNFSHNQIRGTIVPAGVAFEFVKGSTLIDLSSNRIEGPLPRVPSNVAALHLSTILYQALFPIFLNLGNNRLTGDIPNSIGTLRFLQSLDLENNSISGQIPLSLENCTNWEFLHLAENHVAGNIPSWIGGSLSKMKVIILRSNNFNGSVPEEICRLASLQILDLAHNKLSGNIPRCINNFSVMTTMSEHSSNGISYSISMGGFYENAVLVMKRKIVKYGTILNIVRSMDLSSNNLPGEIPEEVTSLIILQSLNLSHNHFHRIIPENIGEIPSSTSRLTFLNYLNLSYKNLKGKIPSSTQLQSFDASSFLGNALWGAPLEENCTVVNETYAKEGGEGQGNKELNGVYVSMELGFVVSFLLTFGFLVIKRR